jgi:hypothetical protein
MASERPFSPGYACTIRYGSGKVSEIVSPPQGAIRAGGQPPPRSRRAAPGGGGLENPGKPPAASGSCGTRIRRGSRGRRTGAGRRERGWRGRSRRRRLPPGGPSANFKSISVRGSPKFEKVSQRRSANHEARPAPSPVSMFLRLSFRPTRLFQTYSECRVLANSNG